MSFWITYPPSVDWALIPGDSGEGSHSNSIIQILVRLALGNLSEPFHHRFCNEHASWNTSIRQYLGEEEYVTKKVSSNTRWSNCQRIYHWYPPHTFIRTGWCLGSGWKEYEKSGTVHGIEMPEGLQESKKLSAPMFTPSTKAEQGQHDENIHPDQRNPPKVRK